MVFVHQTTGGRVALVFEYMSRNTGLNVSIHLLDEDGWSATGDGWSAADANQWGSGPLPSPEELTEVGWGSDNRRMTLAEAISHSGDIPEAEARELANTALVEWRRRIDGPRLGRADTAKGIGLVTMIGGGVLLTIALVVGATVLVVKAL